MFSRALIATDMSESSERFLRCKAGLRKLGVRDIVLGICVRAYEIGGVRANVEDILKDDLDRRRTLMEAVGYAVSAQVLVGEPYVEVNRLAEAEKYDLVVVGSRVHSLAGEVFLSGVAGEILHYCRWPLLVARISDEEEENPRECPLTARDRVLFPTDFSENAEHAFAAVVTLVQEGHQSVVLMHVQDRTRIDHYLKDRLVEFNVIDTDRLERLKQSLLAAGAQDVQIELPYGLPTEEILRRTRQGDVALTVMGTRGRGFLSEVLLGSVSHNLARHAPIPVLLIPALR